MRTILMTICYDGRPFCGWQVQKNGVSVMETVQDAMEAVLQSRPDVKGCSRTDAGVHASRYCLSFSTDKAIPCERLTAAMNVHLPKSVAVLGCAEVREGFHARYCAQGKRYRYKIYNAPVRSPFWEGLAHWERLPLDERLLDREAQGFVGTHDFSAFSNAGSSVTDTVRTVFRCGVTRDGELVEFFVEGDGFLYNMVRIMAGTLLDVARGRLEEGAIPGILASGERGRAGVTAPACGLWLDEVFYPQQTDSKEVP